LFVLYGRLPNELCTKLERNAECEKQLT